MGLPVPAKNSVSRKDRIVQNDVKGPRELLNGRALHIGWGAESGTLLFLPVQSPRGTGLTPGEETPFLSENKPLRRPPLVLVMESADFRKFNYATKLRRLNGP